MRNLSIKMLDKLGIRLKDSGVGVETLFGGQKQSVIVRWAVHWSGKF